MGDTNCRWYTGSLSQCREDCGGVIFTSRSGQGSRYGDTVDGGIYEVIAQSEVEVGGRLWTATARATTAGGGANSDFGGRGE